MTRALLLGVLGLAPSRVSADNDDCFWLCVARDTTGACMSWTYVCPHDTFSNRRAIWPKSESGSVQSPGVVARPSRVTPEPSKRLPPLGRPLRR